MSRAIALSILLAFAATAFAEDAKPAPAKKLAEPKFVGNFIMMYQPASGGATEQWVVDIDESGNYHAMCQSADWPPVRGILQAQDGKWTLTSSDGKPIDSGTYEFAPLFATLSPRGKGMWTQLSPFPQQKQLAHHRRPAECQGKKLGTVKRPGVPAPGPGLMWNHKDSFL